MKKAKANQLMKTEKIGKSVMFVISSPGFSNDALDFMIKSGVAYSDNPEWFEQSFKE